MERHRSSGKRCCLHYRKQSVFPRNTIRKEYFKPGETDTTCPWKGRASQFTLEVDGKKNIYATWNYPEVSELDKPIQGRIAFLKGVEIRV